MSGIPYHNRDYTTNTVVMQQPGLITCVNTVGERVKWAREQRKLSQQQLAKRAGVAQSTIGNLEAGTRQRPRSLVAIAAALEASVAWIDSGEGHWQRENSNVSPVVPSGRVPLISWVQAGHWGDVTDPFHPGEADQWVVAEVEGAGPHAFALRVVGDSMTSQIPGARSFPEGTIIIVDPDRAAGAGDYVIAKDVQTQQATFKQLATDGGRWYLRPLNPSYPTVEIDDPAIRVIGRAIEFRPPGGKL